jgi:hypothetical protein
MVPRMATILHRVIGAWATRLPPDARLAVCGALGSTAGRDRGRTPVTTVP